MAVSDAGVLDLITHNPDTDEVTLTMIESRPWDGSPIRLLEIQDKVNGYLAFAFEGQLQRMYPQLVGKPLKIQLNCLYRPDATAKAFFAVVDEAVREHGVSFGVRLLEEDKPS